MGHEGLNVLPAFYQRTSVEAYARIGTQRGCRVLGLQGDTYCLMWPSPGFWVPPELSEISRLNTMRARPGSRALSKLT